MVPVLPDMGRFQPAPAAAPAAVPAPTESLDMATARVLASPSSTTCSHCGSFSSTGFPVRSVIDSMGLGGHHTPPDARVAPTLDSSSALTAVGPRVNDPRLFFLMNPLIESPPAAVPLRSYERKPSRTAMSTVGATPTSLMRLTNVVLGDWARASGTRRDAGYEPAFSTQYWPAGQPAAPPEPRPATWTRRGTGREVLVPMPFSIAAATVKTLNTEPAPSPTSENGCGWTVWLSPSSRPYWRLEAIATTLWESLPGRTTLITSATPCAVGLP